MLLYPAEAKGLSVALKSSGNNGSLIGALLVEGDTLQGRGVKPVDLRADALKRCHIDTITPDLASVDPAALSQAIRDVLEEEIRLDRVEFMTDEEFWDRRWAWCVNGSHSKVLERAKPGYKIHELPGISHYYRRVFAENYPTNPLPDWDSNVYVSVSPKLEHGKTRVIYSCDTISYFAFEHLMAGVEPAWQGRRVILNPGRGGTVGMVSRVRALQQGGSIDIMLDYDDFNSQHTIQAQQEVIRQVVAMTGYDAGKGAKLVESFARMQIYQADKKCGTAQGSLMSGHRCTTFLNSVLNAAYIRASVPRDLYARTKSMHVGDDVYMRAASYDDCAAIVRGMKRSRCRMNPAKQSIGTYTAEFLRTAIRPGWAIGYAARAISSIVSGNWVSDVKLEGVSALQGMIQSNRTLFNRTGGVDFTSMLSPSVARITGMFVGDVTPLLRGHVALNGGPCFASSGTYRSSYLFDDISSEDKQEVAKMPALATHDYLSKCATPVEVFALVLTGNTVKSAMLGASYMKSLPGGKRELKVRELRYQQPVKLFGSISVEEALKLEPEQGALASYPLLQLIKNRLRSEDIGTLLRHEGVSYTVGNERRIAWGPEVTPCCIQGFIPYQDACSASARTNQGVIYTPGAYYT
jgi:hypothetical protein